ncbi:hypothetical protein AMTR_s01067p00008280, partial [Amborella trichopoda]
MSTTVSFTNSHQPSPTPASLNSALYPSSCTCLHHSRGSAIVVRRPLGRRRLCEATVESTKGNGRTACCEP